MSITVIMIHENKFKITTKAAKSSQGKPNIACIILVKGTVKYPFYPSADSEGQKIKIYIKVYGSCDLCARGLQSIWSVGSFISLFSERRVEKFKLNSNQNQILKCEKDNNGNIKIWRSECFLDFWYRTKFLISLKNPFLLHNIQKT